MNAQDECPCRGGPRTFARRCVGAIGWVVPASVLTLMPKCPACVAAYLAVAGVGISTSAAASFRTAAIGVSAATLLCLVAASIYRRRMRKPPVARQF